VVLDVAVRILVDVRVVEPDLVLVHACEGVGDLPAPGAQGLDLGTMQDDARLEGLEDVKVVPGFRIVQDVGHVTASLRRMADGIDGKSEPLFFGITAQSPGTVVEGYFFAGRRRYLVGDIRSSAHARDGYQQLDLLGAIGSLRV
jgi:hypothetical protein